MRETKALLGVMADSITLNPAAGGLGIQVDGESDGELPLRLLVGGHEVVIDVSPTFGGDDDAPDPVAHALAALAACQMITFHWWATRLDVAIDRVLVTVYAHVDLRGSLGTDGEVRPGLQHVEIATTVIGSDTDERYAEVGRTVDRCSPLLDLFANGTVTSSILTTDNGE